jgi:hypothetical protein
MRTPHACAPADGLSGTGVWPVLLGPGGVLDDVDEAGADEIDGVEGLDSIAARCGIGTGESLRQLFRRELGMTPARIALNSNPLA